MQASAKTTDHFDHLYMSIVNVVPVYGHNHRKQNDFLLWKVDIAGSSLEPYATAWWRR